MQIKRGSTKMLSMRPLVNTDKVSSIVVTFSDEETKRQLFQKIYPTEITLSSETGFYNIPLTQADTLKLTDNIEVEAQYDLTDLSVYKTDIGYLRGMRTLATRPLSGNAPNDDIPPLVDLELHELVNIIPPYIFNAVYGESTYDEVKAAYDAHKPVFVRYQNVSYCLVSFVYPTETLYFFATDTQSRIFSLTLDRLSGWSYAGVTYLEDSVNKVTSLTSSSTDTEYPSAKAVFDALAEKQDELVAGYNITVEGNVISADDGLFEANYDVTSFSELEAAYTSGKSISVRYKIEHEQSAVDYVHLYLSDFSYNPTAVPDYQVKTFYFTGFKGNYKYETYCDNLFGWEYVNCTEISQDISGKENISNKVTSMSASSTDTQYPSAKAVYNALTEKQDELVAGDNITIENNIISATGGADNIFIAEYGTTTYDEIEDAYNAGKIIFAIDQSSFLFKEGLYSLCILDKGVRAATFVKIARNNLYTCVCHGTGWTGVEVDSLEFVQNKITSISSSSTDMQYPSAKAVHTKFSNLVKEYSSATEDTQIAYGQGTEEIEVLTTADVETKVLSITDSGVTTNYNVLVVVNNGN